MKPFSNSAGGSSTAQGPSESDVFKTLKSICVPLLSKSLLIPETIPQASSLLSQLSSSLAAIQGTGTIITPSTIEYVFFPLSHILQRNHVSSIPDVIMEKLMGVIAILFEQWWWSCQLDVWEQILMLSAAILGGIDSSSDRKGKKKDRDEETKCATAQCLWSIVRRRTELHETSASGAHTASEADERFLLFQARGQAPKLLPILGQTLTSLLMTSQSAHRGLQTVSLQIMHSLITDYMPESFVPSILPGVVSAMAKVSLGRGSGKGWTSEDTVDRALKVMQVTIVVSIRDEVCETEGALRTVTSLEDLGHVFGADGQPRPTASPPPKVPSYLTPRTSVWLAASASQLHMVLNTLSSLLSHPKPVALISLSRFSHALLSTTTQSLPDSQPLLFSFLLSLSTSQFPEVADASRAHILDLLLPPSAPRFTLLQILSRSTRDNLTSLSFFLPSRNDAKVEHLARQVLAACQLSKAVHAVSEGVGKLLGPTGGIEKWGWSLLSVLEFKVPPFFVSTVQPPQALLGGGGAESMQPFPEVDMKHVSSRSTRDALDEMFCALGTAAGTECLFAVEWFVGVARRGRTSREVAALWCAGRILEGVGGVSLKNTDALGQVVPKALEKVSRWVAKVIAEFWDQDSEDDDPRVSKDAGSDIPESDGRLPLEYVKGLNPLVTRFDNNYGKPTQSSPQSQQMLHKVLSLQLLSITSAILRSRFMRLLLHTLYPILHSLVSPSPYVSSTALAALHYITSATGYASPSNLLLANFDYALDGVARRLDRRQLDPDATKILVVLVRLVGKDIVSRAGDVVEACFDRLDDFHGYSTLVEGLIEVLAEVVKVIEENYESSAPAKNDSSTTEAEDHLESFIRWYRRRNDPIEHSEEDYGPAPREAWGSLSGKGKEREEDEDEPPGPSMQEQGKPTLTPTQSLTQQIVSHSIYFLTHPSPVIRARILGLLDTASPTLSESALLPTIHSAWPYILNRMSDSEPYVMSAAASLIASLAEHVGDFMALRIWNDVWPRFRAMLSKLEEADSHSALARRGHGAVGTESAYTQSHRLYGSILRTMRSVVKGAQLRGDVLWEISVAFRRFLHVGTHQELQANAREVYTALMEENRNVIWLILSATMGRIVVGPSDTDLGSVVFLKEQKWDIEANARLILGQG